MNLVMFQIINFALNHYEKIAAFKFGAGELYLKVYSKKSKEELVKHFEEQCFDVTELSNTVRDPKLIENDIEPGVEFFIQFSIPQIPLHTYVSNEPEN